MLINTSNHPYAFWPKAQLQAAERYGEVTDLPFPVVSPDENEDYIASLADEYVDKIKALSIDKTVTVHVMGEMCLTYSIVSKLKTLGMV